MEFETTVCSCRLCLSCGHVKTADVGSRMTSDPRAQSPVELRSISVASTAARLLPSRSLSLARLMPLLLTLPILSLLRISLPPLT